MQIAEGENGLGFLHQNKETFELLPEHEIRKNQKLIIGLESHSKGVSNSENDCEN